jgi:hypothetical protein
MVAIITTARSLSAAVRYNERKVTTGRASALLAVNYPAGLPALSPAQKLRRLELRADLNTRVSIRCLHITLNFDVSEQLDQPWLRQLSTVYMDRIGFGAQPYLVYEHMDAPHPHLHIVTTAIDREGKRIPIHDLVRRGSRRVTTEMERDFDLLRTHPVDRERTYEHRAAEILTGNLLEEPATPYISLEQDTLGPAMDRVLARVLTDYRFTTLEEFNALLRPYRLEASPGLPGSRTYAHGGLYYTALDEEGRTQRNYIKASKLPGQPTLAYLERRFDRHRTEQETYAARVRNAVDWSLLPETDGSLSPMQGLPHLPGLPPLQGPSRFQRLASLQQDLQSEGIQTVWTVPKDSRAPSLVYIDHKTRWAFGETALGEHYSAPALMERCRITARELEQVLSLDVQQLPGTPDLKARS